MGDSYDLFSINSNNRSFEFYLLHTSLEFFPTMARTTRVSSNSCSLIDNVWTNSIAAVKKSGLILSGIADTFPIFVNQYLATDLLDTLATYKVQNRNTAYNDEFRVLITEVN